MRLVWTDDDIREAEQTFDEEVADVLEDDLTELKQQMNINYVGCHSRQTQTNNPDKSVQRDTMIETTVGQYDLYKDESRVIKLMHRELLCEL